MPSPKQSSTDVTIRAENIGGIESADITFSSGVTVLSGRNATNRTSFLQAIMAALGSDHVSLKGDEDSGSVTLEIGDDTYTRNLERRQDRIALSGNPYLSDPELADLFAFLLESNETRRSVATNGDLRDIIMRPVDVDTIESEIRDLQSDRAELTEKIEEYESLKRDLPSLEEKLAAIKQDIESTEERLEEKQTKLNDRSAEAAEARNEQSELESRMETLRDLKSKREDTEFRIQTQHESLEALEKQRAELENKRSDIADKEGVDLERLQSELDQLRSKKQRLESEMSELQNVVQFNEQMLEGKNEEVFAALRGKKENGSATDQLLDNNESVACWTCGTEVKSKRIKTTIETLQGVRQAKHSEKEVVAEEITDLKSEISEVKSQQSEQASIKRQLDDTIAEIEEREQTIDRLEENKLELTEQIESVEAEIEEIEVKEHSEVLSLHREVNELEVERDRLQERRGEVRGRIDDIEARTDEIETLESQKDDINERIKKLRTRVNRLEADTVENFNEHMETVLNKLGYENLERIWLDRVETQVRDGRRKISKTEFQLHVVRSTDGGVTYEDEFKHLSESEREVTGLVFALAGYLAHEVYETVPFILLDSVEAIDADRIAALVEYLKTYAEYLVVALLHEDAQALDSSHEYIIDI